MNRSIPGGPGGGSRRPGKQARRAQNEGMSPLLRRTKKKPAERVVTLVGKPGCHLCEDARAVVSAVCEETGASWVEKDITDDEELYKEYWEQIPVVLIDGEQHTFWRVDPARLRKALGADAKPG